MTIVHGKLYQVEYGQCAIVSSVCDPPGSLTGWYHQARIHTIDVLIIVVRVPLCMHGVTLYAMYRGYLLG